MYCLVKTAAKTNPPQMNIIIPRAENATTLLCEGAVLTANLTKAMPKRKPHDSSIGTAHIRDFGSRPNKDKMASSIVLMSQYIARLPNAAPGKAKIHLNIFMIIPTISGYSK
jgi:hypothetical protein